MKLFPPCQIFTFFVIISGLVFTTNAKSKLSDISSLVFSSKAREPALPKFNDDGVVRIAFCLTGQVRTLKETHVSIKKFIVNFAEGANIKDLFIYVDPNCSPYICDMSNLGVWLSYLQPVAYRLYDKPYNESKDMVPESGCEIPNRKWPSDQAFWHQHEKNRLCYEMVKETELRAGWKYDFVVKFRADLLFKKVSFPVSELKPSSILSVDKCHSMAKEGGALCDQVMVVPRKWSDAVFSAVNAWTVCRSADDDAVPCHIPQLHFPENTPTRHQGTPSECLLAAWLLDEGIKTRNFKSIPLSQVDYEVVFLETDTRFLEQAQQKAVEEVRLEQSKVELEKVKQKKEAQRLKAEEEARQVRLQQKHAATLAEVKRRQELKDLERRAIEAERQRKVEEEAKMREEAERQRKVKEVVRHEEEQEERLRLNALRRKNERLAKLEKESAIEEKRQRKEKEERMIREEAKRIRKEEEAKIKEEAKRIMQEKKQQQQEEEEEAKMRQEAEQITKQDEEIRHKAEQEERLRLDALRHEHEQLPTNDQEEEEEEEDQVDESEPQVKMRVRRSRSKGKIDELLNKSNELRGRFDARLSDTYYQEKKGGNSEENLLEFSEESGDGDAIASKTEQEKIDDLQIKANELQGKLAALSDIHNQTRASFISPLPDHTM